MVQLWITQQMHFWLDNGSHGSLVMWHFLCQFPHVEMAAANLNALQWQLFNQEGTFVVLFVRCTNITWSLQPLSNRRLLTTGNFMTIGDSRFCVHTGVVNSFKVLKPPNGFTNNYQFEKKYKRSLFPSIW